MLGIKIAASTVWRILENASINPAPERATTTWGAFLRSQADAILACDCLATFTLSGQRQYVLTVIEHATRRIRILGSTAHPTAAWVTQAAHNLVMDVQDAGATVRYLIRDRDAKFPALFDEVLADAGIASMNTLPDQHGRITGAYNVRLRSAITVSRAFACSCKSVATRAFRGDRRATSSTATAVACQA